MVDDNGSPSGTSAVRQRTASRVPPGSPSVGFVAFTNASGDARHDGPVDRLADTLAVALGASSRYTDTRSGRVPSAEGGVAEIARALGVRFVVQGRATSDGERVRLTADLHEVGTAEQLWTETYECRVSDVDEWYAELTDRIVVAVSAGMEASELRRLAGRPIEALDAVEAIWVGSCHLGEVTRADLMRARALFQHAVDVDPGLLSGFAFLGATYTQEATNGWNADMSLLERAWELGATAIDSATPAAAGYQILGTVHVLREEWEASIPYLDRAIALDPHVMWPHALRGMAYGRSRHWSEAAKSMHRALRLAPAGAAGSLLMSAYVEYRSGAHGEAIDQLEQVRSFNPDNVLARVALAAFYSRQGRVEEAKICVKEILAISPQMTVAWALRQIPGLEMIAGRREFRDYPRYLVDAGLPLR